MRFLFFLVCLFSYPLCLGEVYKNNDTLWYPHHVRGKNISQISSSLASDNWHLDQFKIRWDRREEKLSITHSGDPGRVLWSSINHRAFIMAAGGVETVKQWRGSFTLKDRGIGVNCTRQQLDRVFLQGNSLKFEGWLTGENCHVTYTLTWSVASDRRLRFEIDIGDNSSFYHVLSSDFEAEINSLSSKPLGKINRTFLIYSGNQHEGIYGFGEQYTSLNLKNKAVPVIAQEQGHFRGLQPYTFLINQVSPGAGGDWHTTYTGIPQYISSNKNGFFLEDFEYTLFDFTQTRANEVRIWKKGMTGQIIFGESYLDLIEEYTEYSGRMKLLPQWIHRGAIIGTMGGTEWVRHLYDLLKVYKTPVSAFWLQDWVGKRETDLATRLWWNWELDREAYPDWENLVSQLRADSIHVLGYVNPFLSDVSEKETVTKNLFLEAQKLGYLTTWDETHAPAEIDSGGFTGTLIDFSNPNARSWFKNYIKTEMFQKGFSGWMADFGEGLPFNLTMYNGESGSLYHNKYPLEWAKVNREILSEAGRDKDAVIFLRTASAQSPKYTSLFWLGDQMVTWDDHDGLKSAITGLLSSGFSGMSINHSDIGGFIGMQKSFGGINFVNFTRSKELLIRWIEMNAFSAIFRTHEGNNPEVNHQFYSDELTLKFFSYFAKLYAALAPYRDTLFKEANEKGYPVVRHPLLHFPSDPEVLRLKYQYMLGSEFMIAPVTEPGVVVKDVYLPEGTWVHLWTGQVFDCSDKGRWLSIGAPLGYPAIFFRGGSVWGKNLAADLVNMERGFRSEEILGKKN